MYGPFNTDTSALKQRQHINTQNAKHNLETWILDQVKVINGMEILDLGCGTGKQLSAIKHNAKLVGIDISQDAVNEANKNPNITAIHGSFDDPITGKYDLILSIYAIYYAKNMIKTIANLKNNLKVNGRIFLVGPGEFTNHEFNDHMEINPIKDFIEPQNLPFKNIETTRLENSITFNDSKILLQWWSNHNSYDEKLVWKLESISYPFNMTKNVLGVHLYD